MKNCILRGVPSSLRQDGWWLGPITPTGPKSSQSRAAQNPSLTTRRYALHALLLAGLIVITQLPGLSDETTLSATPVATVCGGNDVLGFHAASGLRSLAPALQQDTAL